MAYPNYPEQRIGLLTKDGFGNDNITYLDAMFNMILLDGYELNPPEPKYYNVDIPGGNGSLDLTESVFGDVPYSNRIQKFTFIVIDPRTLEQVKTRVSNFLHGKKFKYQLSWDPDYTYVGRFKVLSYTHKMYVHPGLVGTIEIEVEAEPYKYKDDVTVYADAIGGTTIALLGGRLRVPVTIETSSPLRVIVDGRTIDLDAGTWTLSNYFLKEGYNELYLNSFSIKNLTWGDLKNNNITWQAFKTKRLYEWYKSNGDGTYVSYTWDQLSTKTWDEISNKTWDELQYSFTTNPDIKEIKPVYIQHKVGDL